MAACEMCGIEKKLLTVLVEGAELRVCKNCSSYGTIVKKPVIKEKIEVVKQKPPEREIIQIIREDYPKIIREKRERLGLKQKEFAKFLAERESLIHKIESGSYAPSLEMARKMERQLNIKLVERKQIEPQKLETKTEKYTIGDMINVK